MDLLDTLTFSIFELPTSHASNQVFFKCCKRLKIQNCQCKRWSPRLVVPNKNIIWHCSRSFYQFTPLIISQYLTTWKSVTPSGRSMARTWARTRPKDPSIGRLECAEFNSVCHVSQNVRYQHLNSSQSLWWLVQKSSIF